MSYEMQAKVNFKSTRDQEGYSLKSLLKEDIEKIRKIRNEQIDVLRQKKIITKEEQIDYFEKSIFPTFEEEKPALILFSFFKDNIWIGYGGLTHISWEDKRAEVSFLVERERAENGGLYQKDFSHFLNLLSRLAFSDFGFNRLYTETFDFRNAHIEILENFGFKLEGILREHSICKGDLHDSLMHGLLAKEFLE